MNILLPDKPKTTRPEPRIGWNLVGAFFGFCIIITGGAVGLWIIDILWNLVANLW